MLRARRIYRLARRSLTSGVWGPLDSEQCDVVLKAIYLHPLGELDAGDLLERLAADVGEAFGVECSVRQALPLGDEALDPSRSQFSSPWLLDRLRTIDLPEGTTGVAVADVDLYAEGLDFVFGQAQMPGQWAIVSIARLRGEGADARQMLYHRALKEVVHEVGHTVGFGHCPDPACVMRFSNALADTDRKSHLFCAVCRQRGW